MHKEPAGCGSADVSRIAQRDAMERIVELRNCMQKIGGIVEKVCSASAIRRGNQMASHVLVRRIMQVMRKVRDIS